MSWIILFFNRFTWNSHSLYRSFVTSSRRSPLWIIAPSGLPNPYHISLSYLSVELVVLWLQLQIDSRLRDSRLRVWKKYILSKMASTRAVKGAWQLFRTVQPYIPNRAGWNVYLLYQGRVREWHAISAWEHPVS